MSDTYTGVGAVSVDQTAYDLAVYQGLRQQLFADSFADVQSTAQSFNGATIKFTVQTDLSANTTTLNESTDVDATALADSQITLTCSEYGASVISTKLLRSSSFVPYDPVVADAVAWQAGISQNALAMNELRAGTNVRYATAGATDPTARNQIEPEDTFSGDLLRRAVAELRGAHVREFGMGMYVGIMHPDVSYDFQGTTGASGWRDPHTYSDPGNIYRGEIGAYQGVRIIEVGEPQLVFADAGSSTTLTDVYATIVLGRQALAKGFGHSDGNGPHPMFVPGPVTDKLRRNVPMGWYWFGGYKVFRQAALRRLETSSSIGAN